MTSVKEKKREKLRKSFDSGALLGGEGEILLAACAALHCCGARKNLRAYAILDFFDRSHSSRSLHPPPAAVALVPLAGARVQIFSDPPTKKAHLAVCFSLAEKERCISCTQHNLTNSTVIEKLRLSHTVLLRRRFLLLHSRKNNRSPNALNPLVFEQICLLSPAIFARPLRLPIFQY